MSEQQTLSANTLTAVGNFFNSTQGGNIPAVVISPLLTNMTGCNLPMSAGDLIGSFF